MPKRTPDPTDKHVGLRVRTRRMMLGMSQEKLGDALGLTFQQVQKYEKGANRIGSGRLQQIARILQVQIGWFFEGLSAEVVGATDAIRPEYCSPNVVTEFLATSDGMRTVRLFHDLDPAIRRKILAMVETIANPSQPDVITA